MGLLKQPRPYVHVQYPGTEPGSKPGSDSLRVREHAGSALASIGRQIVSQTS